MLLDTFDPVYLSLDSSRHLHEYTASLPHTYRDWANTTLPSACPSTRPERGYTVLVPRPGLHTMAYSRPGGGASFQQAQVAFPPLSNPRLPSAPGSRLYFHPIPSPSSRPATFASDVNVAPSSQPFVNAQFDIFEWHVHHQSCVRYFLDHAQHTGPVQAVAAFVNIQLPCQRVPHPILSSKTGTPPPTPSTGPAATAARDPSRVPPPPLPMSLGQPLAYITLVPYIRRLVATGFDFPAVLHGFFGDDWLAGIGRIHETERRNYLFAAKSDTWLKVKTDYDLGPDQTIPFLQPLQAVNEKEIVAAESKWSEWLAMQDWMLGPRTPVDVGGVHGGVAVKREEE